MTDEFEASVSRHAIRLTFDYSGTDVRLVESQRVEMIAPPAERTILGERQVGSWIEIRDAEKRVLYQQALHRPIRFDVEVAEASETRKMQWHPLPHRKGTFEVVVPDIAEAESIILYSSPPDAIHDSARVYVRLAKADIAPTGDET